VSGYHEALTGLARPVAALLAAGPPASGELLPAGEVPVVLAARDVVTAEVAALVRRLIDAGPVSAADLRPGDVVSDPAHVLHAALYDLPSCSAGFAGGRGWLSGGGGWAAAARAAVGFEQDHERVAALPGAVAWRVVRDVADLAAALPFLDSDVAARLPAGYDVARAVLAGPGPQDLVGLAAAQLREQLADLGEGRPAGLLDPTPAAVMVLRSPGDVSEGMRRLAAVLAARAGGVAAVDVRAVSKVLAAGVEIIRTDPGTPARAGDALGEVLAGLRIVQTAAWDTVTRADWRLRTLTFEVYRALRDPAGAAAAGLPWAADVPPVVSALTGAVQRSTAAGAVAVPRDHLGTGRQRALLWVPLPATATTHPLLAGVGQAAAAAQRAQEPLATAHGGEVTPAQRAALAAGRAVAELRAALGDRPVSGVAHVPAPAVRPSHPARRQGWVEAKPPHPGR